MGPIQLSNYKNLVDKLFRIASLPLRHLYIRAKIQHLISMLGRLIKATGTKESGKSGSSQLEGLYVLVLGMLSSVVASCRRPLLASQTQRHPTSKWLPVPGKVTQTAAMMP